MTRVAILWHMHQPYYEDLATGEHVLPWVRLHALKDYYGMVALLREFPSIRLTFNLVPSLLVQLQAFAENRARDRHLELGLKPADQLSDEDRVFILQHFFHVQPTRMIEPYPRYRELLGKRSLLAGGTGSGVWTDTRSYTEEELRDLQVWHKLVWIDPLYLEGDPRVRFLVAKDRRFSEDDKLTLREVELELLQRVVQEYRSAFERGQIEIAASPFYHPILPLLCDTDVYLRAQPHGRLPRLRFQHPKDAMEQLSRAASYHERVFGQRPVGLWPSEGSVSDAIVPLAEAAGFTWMASDELILAKSLGQHLTRDSQGHLDQPELLYTPYRLRVGDSEVSLLFRDHQLSDLIGFTYASWDPEAAARDFVGRIREAGRRFGSRTNGGDATVSIILDGENAWEHYEGGGRPFLRALYGAIASEPGLTTMTCRQACEGSSAVLPSVFPGSWINADFYIWIGHADDHRAWSQLAEARAALEGGAPNADPASVGRAREEALIAEGSDWFWWYGDDHSSGHDAVFDDLFRRHLRNIYQALRKPIPEDLFVTNITTGQTHAETSAPLGLVHPTIDGEETSYFEWIGAALLEVRPASGTMHQVADPRLLFESVRFGFDREHLYVRIDSSRRADDVLTGGLELLLTFFTPPGLRVRVSRKAGLTIGGWWSRLPDGVWVPTGGPAINAQAATILEIAIPTAGLAVTPGGLITFVVSMAEGEVDHERFPGDQLIRAEVPAEDFESVNWTV